MEDRRWWDAEWFTVLLIVALLVSEVASLWVFSFQHGLAIEYKGEVSIGTTLRVLAGVALTARTVKQLHEQHERGKSAAG